MAAARQALVLHQSVKYREKSLTSNQLLKFLTLKDSFVSFYRIMFCFWIRSVAGEKIDELERGELNSLEVYNE